MRHPESRGRAVQAVAVHLNRERDRLSLTYTLRGRIDQVRIPSPRPPRVAERLWQHTCCEVFIAGVGASDYHEFNFSPSGEWAAYAFTDYRQGGPLATPDPGIAVHGTPETLELAAHVALAFAGTVALGLCAVIEEHDGTLSYWALRHGPGSPDFHDRDAFALELP